MSSVLGPAADALGSGALWDELLSAVRIPLNQPSPSGGPNVDAYLRCPQLNIPREWRDLLPGGHQRPPSSPTI